MNKEIMKQAGFEKEVVAVKSGLCPFCILPVTLAEFRNPKKY